MRRVLIPALIAVLLLAGFVVQVPAANTRVPFNFTVRADASGNGATVNDPEQVVWFLTTLPQHPERNTPASMQVVAHNRDYQQVASYRGTVHFSAGDASVDLPSDYTFTAADAGAHTFSVTAVNNGPFCPGSNVTVSALTNATNPSFNWHAAHGGAGYPFDTQIAVVPYASVSGRCT